LNYKSLDSGLLYESRQAALDAIIAAALSRFDPVREASHMTKADEASFPRMIERLTSATLFGFEEPEPEPFQEWFPEMIAFEVNWIATCESFRLMDVVRSMDVGKLSKTGSFFEIPTPWDAKKTRSRRDDAGDE